MVPSDCGMRSLCAVTGCGLVPSWLNTDGKWVCDIHRDDPRGFRCTTVINAAGDQCANDAVRYYGTKPVCEKHSGVELKLRVHDREAKKVFDSGAQCTDIEERYDLICPTGLKRIAARYGLGAKKYSDYNWCLGGNDPAFIRARLNHLIKHVNEYLLHGNDKDDNLAAIAWNAIALMHFEEGCTHHHVRTAHP